MRARTLSNVTGYTVRDASSGRATQKPARGSLRVIRPAWCSATRSGSRSSRRARVWPRALSTAPLRRSANATVLTATSIASWAAVSSGVGDSIGCGASAKTVGSWKPRARISTRTLPPWPSGRVLSPITAHPKTNSRRRSALSMRSWSLGTASRSRRLIRTMSLRRARVMATFNRSELKMNSASASANSASATEYVRMTASRSLP